MLSEQGWYSCALLELLHGMGPESEYSLVFCAAVPHWTIGTHLLIKVEKVTFFLLFKNLDEVNPLPFLLFYNVSCPFHLSVFNFLFLVTNIEAIIFWNRWSRRKIIILTICVETFCSLIDWNNPAIINKMYKVYLGDIPLKTKEVGCFCVFSHPHKKYFVTWAPCSWTCFPIYFYLSWTCAVGNNSFKPC